MYLVRNVFRAKPGKAKELVAKLKAASPHYRELGVDNVRLMTDAVGPFWSVVIESEVADLSAYIHGVEHLGEHPELRAAMAGYLDLVESGQREIYRLE